MLTASEAASRLDVSISLIYQLCKDQILRHYRIGGRGKRGSIRIEEAEVERYLSDCLKQEKIPLTAPLKHISLGNETRR